tara:strand:+ start:927 stop:1055 length:129 start_codon:yes stop_codon:yes gene_type:complete
MSQNPWEKAESTAPPFALRESIALKTKIAASKTQTGLQNKQN